MDGLALGDAEQAIYDYDAEQKVGHVELHGSHTCSGSGHEVTCKVGQCGTILVESHPEEDYHSIHKHQAHDALGGLALAQFLLVGRVSLDLVLLLHVEHLLEGGFETIIDADGDDERYTCHSKGKVVRVCFTDVQ